MEIIKVADYKVFANTLKRETGCDVKICVLATDHIHYELRSDGVSLGVLCINKDEVSFAPFETLETAENDQYINMKFFPLYDDFSRLLGVFRKMFVSQE